MSTWVTKVDVITLFVDDLSATKAFYEKVFKLASIYEDENSAVFDFDNLRINLLKTEASHELIAPAPVASSAAGARFQFTIDVDDVDATCRELAAWGVAILNGPMDRPWGIRTASFMDPGGHIWEVAH